MKSRNDFAPDAYGDKDYREYLRKYFAAMAMQGLLSQHSHNIESKILEPIYKSLFICGAHDQNDHEELSRDALAIADELLNQLSQ